MNQEFDLEEYREKLYDAQYSDDNVEAKKIAEEIINIAQLHGDLDLEFEAKSLYLKAATFLDESENMLATYPWLLSHLDQYPDRFDVHSTLWAYKWVVVALPKFPHISLQQINSALDDMEHRFMKEEINNISTNLFFRTNIAEMTGNMEKVNHYLPQLIPIMYKRSSLGNCKACVGDYMVKLHKNMGQYEKALEYAAPIIAKKMSCAEVPERTYPHIMLCYWHLGNLKEAKKIYNKYKPNIKSNEGQLEDISGVITYLSLINNTSEALELFQQKYIYSMNRLALMDNFEYYLSALILFGKLKAQNMASVKLNMPKEFELYSMTNEYSTEAIFDFLMLQATEIAKKFDVRNENSYFSEQIDKALKMI